LVTVQIFDFTKSEAREIARQRGWIEEQLEGFTGAGHSLGQSVERPLLDRTEKRWFHGEVECYAAARWHAGDELDSRVKSGPRKIRRDAQPGEERPSRWAEAGLLQPGVERMRLKVNSSERHLFRNLNASFSKARSLPFLRRGMIHFEDMQSRGSQRISVGEGIESSAQHDVLANTPLDGASKVIFGETAARRDERSKGSRVG